MRLRLQQNLTHIIYASRCTRLLLYILTAHDFRFFFFFYYYFSVLFSSDGAKRRKYYNDAYKTSAHVAVECCETVIEPHA